MIDIFGVVSIISLVFGLVYFSFILVKNILEDRSKADKYTTFAVYQYFREDRCNGIASISFKTNLKIVNYSQFERMRNKTEEQVRIYHAERKNVVILSIVQYIN